MASSEGPTDSQIVKCTEAEQMRKLGEFVDNNPDSPWMLPRRQDESPMRVQNPKGWALSGYVSDRVICFAVAVTASIFLPCAGWSTWPALAITSILLLASIGAPILWHRCFVKD